jgi:hypothetical protein
MTTPPTPRTAPAAAAAPAAPAAPAGSDERLDAIAAAVSAIARHITGGDDDHQALTRFGLTGSQARAITGETAPPAP